MEIGDKVRVIGGGKGEKESYHFFNNGDIVTIIDYDGDYKCERSSDCLVQTIFEEDLNIFI